MMKMFAVYFICVLTAIVSVNGIRQYNMCSSSSLIQANRGAILLNLTSTSFFDDRQCSVKIIQNVGHKLTIRPIRYNTGCVAGSLKIYGHMYSKIVCGPQFSPVLYTSTGGYIRLTFNATGKLPVYPPGFSLLITSFRTAISCRYSEFRCRNRRCISKSLTCDGYNNCGDNSDEHSRCLQTTTVPTTTRSSIICNKDEFKCDDEHCIPNSWKCNGIANCIDRSDEPDECISINNDTVCDYGQMKCDNGRCISMSLRCDGISNCIDRSDEHGCSSPSTTPNPRCRYGQFRCDNGRCILRSWKCDRVNDCGDYSDEDHCPSTTTRPSCYCPDVGGCHRYHYMSGGAIAGTVLGVIAVLVVVVTLVVLGYRRRYNKGVVLSQQSGLKVASPSAVAQTMPPPYSAAIVQPPSDPNEQPAKY